MYAAEAARRLILKVRELVRVLIFVYIAFILELDSVNIYVYNIIIY